ncbi:MAG: hypothetical protein HIU92_03850 [Proteobacteria bacterium]|nr:hypothetical protein [Pseudomonadota bacterium]
MSAVKDSAGVVWDRLRKLISDDSMSIALFSLFLVCVVGQGLSGWSDYDGSLRAAHFHPVSLGAYLGTGTFLDGMLSNWQAAVLQLAVLIAFGSVLRQKGAAHSRQPKPDTPEAKALSHRTVEWKLGTRSTAREWVYANSLSLAFLAMFLATFVLHAVFGDWKHNEDQALRHLPPMPLGAYTVSSNFWFSVFQCWEAEFAVIGIYIVLSIFLRQENSSESKPVGASDAQTGGANE